MSDSDHQTQMIYGFNHMQNMRIFFTLGMYYDIELIIREKRYKTHKSILHAASQLFRAKLDQNIRELVMDCEGIRDESIKKAFEFLYKGTVELRLELVANAIKLSKIWQLDEFEKYCYSYLETVCRDNRQVSQKNDEIDDYLLINFWKLSKHDRFLKLSGDKVKRLLSSDSLQVFSEHQVFEGLSQWIKYDWINRMNDLYSLMKCIRFPFCSVLFLLEEVTSLCCESVKECQLLLDALKWHLMPQKRSTLFLMNSKSRIKNIAVLILGGHKACTSVKIEAYNLTTNSFTDSYKMKVENTDFSTALFKNHVFMFGGWKSDENSNNRVYSIDLFTKELKHLEPMIEKRSNSIAVVVNKRIFVTGGYDGENTLNTVEKYDYVKNSWKHVTSMRSKRHGHASIVYKKDIYVFGGYDGRNFLNSVEVYSTKKNQWMILSPMKWNRSSLAAVVVHDYIYCIGGCNSENILKNLGLQNVERYHPESDTWTEVSDLPVKDFGLSAICHNRKIISFGGYYSGSVHEYDPANDKWKIIGEMPNSQNHYNALVVD